MSIQIAYQNRIVCFIDILGFAKIIKDSIHTDSEKSSEALTKLATIYDTFEYINFKSFMNIEITQFSDSMVLSIPYNEEDGAFFFIVRLQHLIMELAGNEILCRGGIAIGELYHDDTTVFGPALVDAYMLESKIANYPRVIVGPDIIKIAKTYKGNQNSEKHIEEYFSKILGFDSDGFYYIEYLNVYEEFDHIADYPIYLDAIHSMIEEGLRSNDITIRAKYTWLGLKYNELIPIFPLLSLPYANVEHLIIPLVNDKYK